MLLHPFSPSSVQPGLRKHGSFLSCGLGTVSALRKMQLSHRAGLLTFPCPQKNTTLQCVQHSDTRHGRWVSKLQQDPHLDILRWHFSWRRMVYAALHKPMFVGKGVAFVEWHFSDWQRMAASVLTLCVLFRSLAPQESRLLKNPPSMNNDLSLIIIITSIIYIGVVYPAWKEKAFHRH